MSSHTTASRCRRLSWCRSTTPSLLTAAISLHELPLRIEENVDGVPCFPPSYKIYNLYIREYHRPLGALISILVCGWAKEYKLANLMKCRIETFTTRADPSEVGSNGPYTPKVLLFRRSATLSFRLNVIHLLT